MKTLELEQKTTGLNLGGRTTRIEGLLNVDLYDGAGVDVKADVSDLAMFKDCSQQVIYASHILEHFSHTRTLFVLEEWCRVLARDGKAYISVPDFEAVVKLYMEDGMNDWIRNFLWGDQGYPLAFHFTGFTYPTLAGLLCRAGFRDVKRLKFMPYGMADCSTLLDTKHQKPVSLTVEATK